MHAIESIFTSRKSLKTKKKKKEEKDAQQQKEKQQQQLAKTHTLTIRQQQQQEFPQFSTSSFSFPFVFLLRLVLSFYLSILSSFSSLDSFCKLVLWARWSSSSFLLSQLISLSRVSLFLSALFLPPLEEEGVLSLSFSPTSRLSPWQLVAALALCIELYSSPFLTESPSLPTSLREERLHLFSVFPLLSFFPSFLSFFLSELFVLSCSSSPAAVAQERRFCFCFSRSFLRSGCRAQVF